MSWSRWDRRIDRLLALLIALCLGTAAIAAVILGFFALLSWLTGGKS